MKLALMPSYSSPNLIPSKVGLNEYINNNKDSNLIFA